MKKLLYLFLAITVACADDEGNPCVYSPTLTTSAVTNVTETSATLNGVISIVSQNCEDPTNTEQGFVYATTIQPTIANTQVNVNGAAVTTTLENLEPNTTYYTRTFLTNTFGAFYGNEVSFMTGIEQPCEYNLITLEATDITSSSGTLNGTISIDEENCEFPIIEQGFVFSTEVQPTIADTQVNLNGTDVTTTIENLEPNTTYYVRTFLTNNDGEFYGNEISFTTNDGFCNNGDVVYLADNGITIKACPDAQIGDTGVINGITYTVVSEQQLRDYVNSGYPELNRLVTTQVTDMSELFFLGFDNNDLPIPNYFNQDISSWDVSNVTNMSGMFLYAESFNQPIVNWDVSNVTDMSSMFYVANTFNQPIGNWNTGSVTDMAAMFIIAQSFNQPIGNWNTSNVTNMRLMFYGAQSFNQPIGNWNTSNVTNMERMFYLAQEFNQPIGNWNTSNVTNMSGMFFSAQSFNQPIGDWNTGSVTDMTAMFFITQSFNQDISNWDVSNVTNMSGMFYGADAFNRPIGNWNTSNVTNMSGMFEEADTFNQDLSGWNVDNVTSCDGFYDFTPEWTLPKPNFTNCTP